MLLNKVVKTTVTSLSIGLLAGCAATKTALEHRNLEVQTKMSQSIFLDPVGDKDKTIFIAVKNTTDQDLNIEKRLKAKIASHGYHVVSNPKQAHYLLQANILQVGKMDKQSLESARMSAFGSQVGSTLGALAAAASISNATQDIYAGGLIGAAGSVVADSLVKDVTYGMTTDVQISEKSPLNQKKTMTKKENWQRYRTRVVSSAERVNLAFNEARPALEAGLVKNLAGLF